MNKVRILKSSVLIGICFLLAFALVPGVLFAGGQTEEKSETGKPYEGVTLDIMAGNHFWFNSIEVLFDEFEEMTGCTIVTDKTMDLDLYTKIKTAIKPNSSDYDICVVDQVWLAEFVRNGILEELDKYTDIDNGFPWSLDNIMPSYVEGLSTYNGTLYTIPLGGHSNFLAYRTDLFEEAGIAAPPKNFDELLNVSKKLTTDEHSGIVMRARKGHPIVYTWLQYFYPFGGKFFDDNWKPQLSSPDGVRSLEYLIELTNYAPEDVESYTFSEMLNSFQQGKSAIYQDANVPGIIENPDAGKAILGKVAYAPFPTGKTNSTVMAGWSLGIPKAAENKELAWMLIQYQSSRINAPETFKAGRDPILVSSFNDPDVKAVVPDYPFEVVEDNLKYANPDFRPRIPELSKIQEVLGLFLSEALAGEKTAEEALQAADVAIEEIMSDAGYY